VITSTTGEHTVIALTVTATNYDMNVISIHFTRSLVNTKDRHSFWAVSCCLLSFRKNVKARFKTGLAVYFLCSQLIIVVIFIAGQNIRVGVDTAA
jgi:hypothetical protein